MDGMNIPSVPESNAEWLLVGLLLIGLWISLMGLVSWVSGMRDFQRVFTRHPRIRGRKYWFASVWCGKGPLAVLYPCCFTLTVGEHGLYLEPHFYLRPFHRPMRIAWRSVIDFESRLIGYKLRFVELPVSMTIFGRPARAAHASLRAYAAKW